MENINREAKETLHPVYYDVLKTSGFPFTKFDEKHVRKWMNKFLNNGSNVYSEFLFRNASPFIERVIKPVCPETGEFYGYKICLLNPKLEFERKDISYVKLLIPEDAKRSSGLSSKCRCDKAIVQSITDIFGKEHKEAISFYDRNFRYIVGETVEAKPFFDENRWNDCGSGIHFFMDEESLWTYMRR